MNNLPQISAEQLQQLINLVYVLVIALVALATVGVGAAVMTLRQHKDLLRLLYESASPATQELLRGIAVGVNDVADLAVEITKPAGGAAPIAGPSVPIVPIAPLPPDAGEHG